MVSVVSVVVMFPLTLVRSLSKLAFTTTAALLALGFVIVSLGIRLADTGISPSITTIRIDRLFLLGIPLQSVATVNQFNVLGVYNELPLHQRHKTNSIIHVAMLGVVLPVYALAGFLGYFRFGSATANFGDILDGFPASDVLMLIAGVAIGLTNLLKVKSVVPRIAL